MKVDGQHYRTLRAEPAAKRVHIIDQTLLPHAFEMRTLDSPEAVAEAIVTMRVRGAPLIGVTAAFGVALAMDRDPSDAHLLDTLDRLRATRPTAVNLAWALERMKQALAPLPAARRIASAWELAQAIADEDAAINEAIGRNGLALLEAEHFLKKRPINVLTHCNAGWIATVDWGTALAPLYMAHDKGIPVHVWVDETRPLGQGARLTAWELERAGVPSTVIVDSAAGALMAAGEVTMVLVGADRIAANGDVANKIGTYALAVLAAHHGIPFVVVAPTSTVDPATACGSAIPVEQRPAGEISERFPARNPAFDVTPGRLVTALVTERGVHRPPFAFPAPEPAP